MSLFYSMAENIFVIEKITEILIYGTFYRSALFTPPLLVMVHINLQQKLVLERITIFFCFDVNFCIGKHNLFHLFMLLIYLKFHFFFFENDNNIIIIPEVKISLLTL